MAKAAQKVTLSPSRDIPFDKLMLSQSNVRRIKAGVSVEELAEDIARRGLLQGLNVRPVVDAEGVETGIHVLYLDRKNRIISDELLSTGTVDHVPVYPREVIKRALMLNASALILIHNHPSGDSTPSEADLSVTKEIQKGCKYLGLTLHDHIIVGAGTELSLRALGKL